MSLRPNDLEGLISQEISIDEYKSKLGEDRSVIVVAMPMTEESAAHDLGDFIERGPFKIWDVDISPAPGKDGKYYVFVEIERSHLMWGTIEAIFEHISRLINLSIADFVFTCPGNEKPQALNEENFKSCVPQSPYRWDIKHGIYPEVPATQPEASGEDKIRDRMRFLTDY